MQLNKLQIKVKEWCSENDVSQKELGKKMKQASESQFSAILAGRKGRSVSFWHQLKLNTGITRENEQ